MRRWYPSCYANRSIAQKGLRWDPDLSPRVVGLVPREWEDGHNEEKAPYP